MLRISIDHNGRSRRDPHIFVCASGIFSQCILIPHLGYLSRTPGSTGFEGSLFPTVWEVSKSVEAEVAFPSNVPKPVPLGSS